MREYDLVAARWRTSTYGDDNGGGCVKVADGIPLPPTVPVQDGRNPDGPVLRFGTARKRFIGALAT